MNFILKCDPKIDLYVEWSTIVDNACFIGTREQCLARGIERERLARADLQGTSCFDYDHEGEQVEPYGSFTVAGFVVADPLTGNFRWLPRGHLFQYCHAFLNDDAHRAWSVTEEITEELETLV